MTRLNMFLDTSTSPLVVLDSAKLAALRKGRGPTGPRPVGHPLRRANSPSKPTCGTQRLRTIRQRPTNTRKRTNLTIHLINIPTQHLLVKVKNIYVTGRHKLRHTDYTGNVKRARESWRTPRPAKLDGAIGAKRAGRLPQARGLPLRTGGEKLSSVLRAGVLLGLLLSMTLYRSPLSLGLEMWSRMSRKP
jgi:hypothetical protein